MLVWLASYPRSGNTLLRVILHKSFNISAPSLYLEGLANGEHDWGDLIPRYGVPDGVNTETFADWARGRPDLLVTKTHQMPDDGDDPAIVVVRDGRAAMVSYERYTANYSEKASELEEIVIGAAPLMNWTNWNRAWMARSARTLLLQYENLARDPESVIGPIEDFLGVSHVRPFDITFSDMNAINPKLFSVGSNEYGIGEIERRCPNLFWMIHYEQMKALGYGEAEARTPNIDLAMAALEEAGGAIRRAKHATTGW